MLLTGHMVRGLGTRHGKLPAPPLRLDVRRLGALTLVPVIQPLQLLPVHGGSRGFPVNKLGCWEQLSVARSGVYLLCSKQWVALLLPA